MLAIRMNKTLASSSQTLMGKGSLEVTEAVGGGSDFCSLLWESWEGRDLTPERSGESVLSGLVERTLSLELEGAGSAPESRMGCLIAVHISKQPQEHLEINACRAGVQPFLPSSSLHTLKVWRCFSLKEYR